MSNTELNLLETPPIKVVELAAREVVKLVIEKFKKMETNENIVRLVMRYFEAQARGNRLHTANLMAEWLRCEGHDDLAEEFCEYITSKLTCEDVD